MRVLVLGATGMLGSMTLKALKQTDSLDVIGTARRQGQDKTKHKLFDVVKDDPKELFREPVDWVVNCIGITKPFIRDDSRAETETAILVNALFPQRLAVAAEESGARVLQIATDCVYSGREGGYTESSAMDALDVYGKTKSLGEVRSSLVHHLRCSIIGPETDSKRFLISWVLGQPKDAELPGWTNHRWNGVTTYHFARICSGIIRHNIGLPHLQHVIPADVVSKAQLLRDIAGAHGRNDLLVKETQATQVVDRTLATDDTNANRSLWTAAGYAEPPSIREMLKEMVDFWQRVP